MDQQVADMNYWKTNPFTPEPSEVQGSETQTQEMQAYQSRTPDQSWKTPQNDEDQISPNYANSGYGESRMSTANERRGYGLDSRQSPLPHPRQNQIHEKARFWTPQVEPRVDPTIVDPSTKQPAGGIRKLFASFRSSSLGHLKSGSSKVVTGQSKPRTKQREDAEARVLLLDGEEISMKLEKHSLGEELMRRICDGQDIIEPDYFGITYTDEISGTWFWLDLNKKILKQIPNISAWQFYFQVKFYPPEPSMLQDDMTRYQLTLQVRQDVFTGKLPCSWVTQALLSSFLVQSELGDYDPTIHSGVEYLRSFEFVRTPNEQLLQKISELHATHKGMRPGQADVKYLETAKRLELYGLDLHPARDLENVEIHIGVGFSGIVIYRDRIRIGRFAWPKVLLISYKKNVFYLKIRPDYRESGQTTVGFHLLNQLLAKRLWKAAVEHHAFFRLKEPRPMPRKRSLVARISGSSQHQFSGRTFFQYRTSSNDLDRPQLNGQLTDRIRQTNRTASVPASLNRADLQYNSLHSLNRTHPRDMTIGKTQSNDYLGSTRTNSKPQARRTEPQQMQRDALQTRPMVANRRPPQSPKKYSDPDGSLFDGGSSRGDGSLLGVSRAGDYEVPRRGFQKDDSYRPSSRLSSAASYLQEQRELTQTEMTFGEDSRRLQEQYEYTHKSHGANAYDDDGLFSDPTPVMTQRSGGGVRDILTPQPEPLEDGSSWSNYNPAWSPEPVYFNVDQTRTSQPNNRIYVRQPQDHQRLPRPSSEEDFL